MYNSRRIWNCNWYATAGEGCWSPCRCTRCLDHNHPPREAGCTWLGWPGTKIQVTEYINVISSITNMEPLKGLKVFLLRPDRVAWQQQGTTQRRLRWWLSPPRFPLLTGHLNTSLGERTQNPDNFPSSDCLKKSFSPWTHQFFFIWHSPEQLGSSSSSESTCQGKICQEFSCLYCLKNLKKFLMDCRQRPLQLQAFALSPCNRSKG